MLATFPRLYVTLRALLDGPDLLMGYLSLIFKDDGESGVYLSLCDGSRN